MEDLFVLHVEMEGDWVGDELYWTRDAFQACFDNLQNNGVESKYATIDYDTGEKMQVTTASYTIYTKLETGGFAPIETGLIM